jgi:hypothetical protein
MNCEDYVHTGPHASSTEHYYVYLSCRAARSLLDRPLPHYLQPHLCAYHAQTHACCVCGRPRRLPREICTCESEEIVTCTGCGDAIRQDQATYMHHADTYSGTTWHCPDCASRCATDEEEQGE